MTEAPGGAAEAPAVTAAAGPAEPPHMRLASARREAETADWVVERMRSKVTQAEAAAKTLLSDARQALKDAQAAQKQARELAARLAKEAGN